MGGFILVPKLTLHTIYDSNVLATNNNEKSDVSMLLTPSLNVQKKYGNHVFVFGGETEIERYISQSGENSEAYKGYLRGILEGNSRWQFPFSAIYTQKPRSRSTPVTTLTPTERLNINTFHVDAGVTRRFNRLSLTLLGEYTDITYEDGVSLDSGAPVIFSDDDRTRTGAKLKLRYDFPRDSAGNQAEHILYANIGYGQSEYKRRQFFGQGFTGPDADNTDMGILVGFETDYKGLVFANIGAGFIRKIYDDPLLNNINTYDLTADIAYNLTPKLTLNAMAERSIDQDNGLAQGVITTDYQIGADYELLHNLYLGGNIGYTSYDFQDISREDESMKSAVHLKYLHSRHFESGLEMRYEDRTSNIQDNEFDRLELLFRLTGKL